MHREAIENLLDRIDSAGQVDAVCLYRAMYKVADMIVIADRQGQAVISIGGRNTLIFFGKMEC